MVLPSWDLIREEKRDLNAVLVLYASQFLMHAFDVLLLKRKKLLMEYFSVVINNQPEGFLLAVPAITPIELCKDSQLDLYNVPSDRLTVNLKLDVRYVLYKLIKFILLSWRDIPGSLVKLLIVKLIHRNSVLFNPVDDVIL